MQSMDREGVNQLAFTSDGRRLISACRGEAAVWDVASGEKIGGKYSQGKVILAPNLQSVALLDSNPRQMRCFDLPGGKPGRVFPGGRASIQCMMTVAGRVEPVPVEFQPRFSPDSRWLLAAAPPSAQAEWGTVYLWDTASGKRLPLVLSGDTVALNEWAFSPDGRLLALVRSDGRLCLASTETGETARWLGQAGGLLGAAPVFTRDGRTLVTAVRNVIQVWEVASGGEMARWIGHQDVVRTVTLSADGRTLVTASADHTALIWDLAHLAGPDRPAADALWAGLGSVDAKQGRRAIEALLAAPAQAVALLQKHLPPASLPDPQQLRRWIVDLGSDDFDQRQAAEEQLDRLQERRPGAAKGAGRQATVGSAAADRDAAEEAAKPRAHYRAGACGPGRAGAGRPDYSRGATAARSMLRGTPEAHLTTEAVVALDRQRRSRSGS